jgi:hypothetical protein
VLLKKKKKENILSWSGSSGKRTCPVSLRPGVPTPVPSPTQKQNKNTTTRTRRS